MEKKKQIPNQAFNQLLQVAHETGCTRDQVELFLSHGYAPIPWQWKFHAAARECDRANGPVKIGAGGARGPGKSRAVFSQMILDDCQRFEGLKCLFLRQTGKAASESFEDLIAQVLRGKVRYDYNSSRNLLRVGKGSRVILGGFENEKDIDKYIGIEYDVIAIEELNQLTKERVDKLEGSLRTSKRGWRPRMYTSFNPGGIGHVWVKDTYVIPYREGREKETRFIPSDYRDNPFLNTEYIQYLERLTGVLGQAWREGDWDILAGRAFPEWSEKHIGDSEMYPALPYYTRFICFDYGYEAPGAMLWIAVDEQENFIVYREVYKTNWLYSDWARAAFVLSGWDQKDEFRERIQYMVIGHDSFARNPQTSKTGVEVMRSIFPVFYEQGAVGPADRVISKILFQEKLNLKLNGKPSIIFYETCENAIRTIPSLPLDEHRLEDVDTTSEDHCYDAIRMAIMSRRTRKTKTPLSDVEKKFQEMKRTSRVSPQNLNRFYANQ